MASSCAVKAWGRRWKRTSLAALMPDWTAPLMYPHQAVADSVPAKWILKHQNVILNLKQNQILQTLLLLFYYIMQKIPNVKQLFTFHFCFIIMARVLYHELTMLKFDKKGVHWLLFIEKFPPCYSFVLRKSKITSTCLTYFRVELHV